MAIINLLISETLHYCIRNTDVAVLSGYHLLDAVKALSVETKGLFKQHFVLHCPLIWERGEIWQVGQRFLNIVFVPEEHAKSLKTHTQRVTKTQIPQAQSSNRLV